jgi:hypothetical protein
VKTPVKSDHACNPGKPSTRKDDGVSTSYANETGPPLVVAMILLKNILILNHLHI